MTRGPALSARESMLFNRVLTFWKTTARFSSPWHHEGDRWLTFGCSVSSPRTYEQCRKGRRPGAGAKASRRERARARYALELAAGWRGGRGPRWEGERPLQDSRRQCMLLAAEVTYSTRGRGVRGCSVPCNSVQPHGL